MYVCQADFLAANRPFDNEGKDVLALKKLVAVETTMKRLEEDPWQHTVLRYGKEGDSDDEDEEEAEPPEEADEAEDRILLSSKRYRTWTCSWNKDWTTYITKWKYS